MGLQFSLRVFHALLLLFQKRTMLLSLKSPSGCPCWKWKSLTLSLSRAKCINAWCDRAIKGNQAGKLFAGAQWHVYLFPSQPHLKSKPWKHPPSCPAQEQNTCIFCRQCFSEGFTWGRRKSLLQIWLVFFVPGAVLSHSAHFWAFCLNWPGLSHESWVTVLCSSPVNPPQILQHSMSTNAPFFFQRSLTEMLKCFTTWSHPYGASAASLHRLRTSH